LLAQKPTIYRILLLGLLVGCVFIAGSTSLVKSMGMMIVPVKQLEQSLGGAIYLHALIALSLGAIAQLTSPSVWRWLPLGLSIAVVPLTFLVVLDESLQYFIPTRYFAWLDMGVNVLGVLSGALLGCAIQKIHSLVLRPV
jgi:hypothetical protein